MGSKEKKKKKKNGAGAQGLLVWSPVLLEMKIAPDKEA
jgi:hypothetical protein